MDVEEFAREVKPRRKRSKLLQFKDQIKTLKSQDYTDLQIRDWLAKNDLNVSRESVRKFIKNHLPELGQAPGVKGHVAPASTPGAEVAQTATVDDGQIKAGESQAEKMRRRTREQKDEAEKTRFKHEKTGNNR
jgi:hypothetical protein